MRRAALAGAGALLALLSVVHFARSAHESRAHGFVDFPIFLAQARLFLLTGELYVDPASPTGFAPGAAVYKFPPLYGMLLLPLVRAGIDDRVYLAHWLLQIALYAVAVGLLLRWLRREAGPGFVFAGLLLALNFEPFFETLWRLQIETPLLLLLVLTLLAYGARRHGLAGAALGAAFLLKLYPGFLLLYLGLRRRWRALVGFGVAVVLLFVATWIVIGPQQNTAYFLRIVPVLLREQPDLTSENLSLARYLITLGALGPQAAKRVAQALVLALIAVSAIVVLRREPARASRLDHAVSFSLFVPLMLLAMPNYWVNYQLLLLLPVLVLLGHASRRGPDAAGCALAGGLAYVPMLFYRPCADPSVSWPCARTPYFLGLGELPRGFHDLMVSLRGVSAFLLWAALLSALLYGGAASPARHATQPEGGDRAR